MIRRYCVNGSQARATAPLVWASIFLLDRIRKSVRTDVAAIDAKVADYATQAGLRDPNEHRLRAEIPVSLQYPINHGRFFFGIPLTGFLACPMLHRSRLQVVLFVVLAVSRNLADALNFREKTAVGS